MDVKQELTGEDVTDDAPAVRTIVWTTAGEDWINVAALRKEIAEIEHAWGEDFTSDALKRWLNEHGI